ncbi:MAG: hypothetical protein QHH26_00840 [Armatimonadota bacterium]|nr:hypothetical protein [Armatimonadota bacterium]MDH7480503.1 hypothetical protein [Armatimonadota bacterium]
MKRAVLIIICIVLFAGLIAYSALKARYNVDGELLGEPAVTELSETHSVERGKDGKLTKPGKEKKETQPGKGKACPT